jgi:hypothetical protein
MGVGWEHDLETALGRSREERRPVVMEFFNPACIGCKQMDELTFSDMAVVAFMEQRTVALRAAHNDKPLTDKYGIKWTPTILMLDGEGGEHHRIVGFLPPDEFIASLLLGSAKTSFDLGDYKGASLIADEILEKHPSSPSAPEAVFLRGVSHYKMTRKPAFLKEAYERLNSSYPTSEWTKRAYPYRLL